MSKKALISVWDKTGVVDFAKSLTDRGYEILSTGGTKKLSFSGIITGTSFSSTVGDISTVSVSFITTGAIISAV